MASSLWRHDWQPLNLAISGESIVDFPRLDVQNSNDAKTFVSAYGYNSDDPIVREEIWRIYFEALHFIRNVLLIEDEAIPTSFFERNNQNDILKLLTEASQPDRERSAWACAILRVMHTISHLDNDLRLENFHTAREKIFSQFDPFVKEVAPRKWVFGKDLDDSISLVRYQKKVRKERNSMILKLISKAQNDVELIYDSLGLRFVVEKRIDAIRLVEKFFDLGAISYANIQPRRSFNNLVDTDQLHRELDVLKTRVENNEISTSQAEELFRTLDLPAPETAGSPKNQFSSQYYRALQFTCRHLIHVQDSTLPMLDRIRGQLGKSEAGKRFLRSFPIVLREKKTFYYPFEIQITDRESYVENLRGRSSHRDYKAKQRHMARKRVLGAIYGIMET
ncbi:MAG: TIGR04552 family protein [Bdellovibrionota bacterium]